MRHRHPPTHADDAPGQDDVDTSGEPQGTQPRGHVGVHTTNGKPDSVVSPSAAFTNMAHRHGPQVPPRLRARTSGPQAEGADAEPLAARAAQRSRRQDNSATDYQSDARITCLDVDSPNFLDCCLETGISFKPIWVGPN